MGKEKRGVGLYLVLFFGAILLLLVLLFVTRLVFSVQLDDVNPYMNCTDYQLEKADMFYVIPYYNGVPISENEAWCEEIGLMNKTLGLHGYTHDYQEFSVDRDVEYLERSIVVFEDCFGSRPEYFRAPNLKINTENKKLLSELGLKLDGRWGYLLHKVYHCDEARSANNKLIRFLLSDKFMDVV